MKYATSDNFLLFLLHKTRQQKKIRKNNYSSEYLIILNIRKKERNKSKLSKSDIMIMKSLEIF